jgi:uncharacterized protein YbdZ (MbtH family)
MAPKVLAPVVHSSASTPSAAKSTSIANAYAAGLFDRQGKPSVSGPSGYVVNVNWSDLEPTRGLLAPNKIDAALASGLKPSQIFARIFAGEYAPLWAKSLDGPPITNGSATLFRYWTPNGIAAWAQLMQLMAAKYDGKLGGISDSACMTHYAEPLLKDGWDSGTGQATAVKAGWTKAAEQACQDSSLDAMAANWKLTPYSLSFNPARLISGSADITFTLNLMAYGVAKGSLFVLENNSLRANGLVYSAYSDPHGSLYTQMYTAMKGYRASNGNRIRLQTSTLTGMGGTHAALLATLDYAIWMQAANVELPQGYQSLLTSADYIKYNLPLALNA